MDGEDKTAETPLTEAPVATPTAAAQVATPQLATVDNNKRMPSDIQELDTLYEREMASARANIVAAKAHLKEGKRLKIEFLRRKSEKQLAAAVTAVEEAHTASRKYQYIYKRLNMSTF